MDPFITQCPKCETAFRVTPDQVEMAQGSVRCGSCMNIFIAEENRHIEKTASPLKQPRQANDTADQFADIQTNSDPEEFTNEEADDFDFDQHFQDDDLDTDNFSNATEGFNNSTESRVDNIEHDDMFLNLDEFKNVDVATDQHGFDEPDDIETAPNLEEEQRANEPTDQISSNEQITSNQIKEELLFDEEFGLDGPDDVSPNTDNPDNHEPPASPAGDADADVNHTANATYEPACEFTEEDFTEEGFTGNKLEPFLGTDSSQETFAAPTTAFDTEMAAKEVLRDQILTAIEPAPVQLMVSDSPVDKAMKAMTNCAVLIAVLSLGAQYAWLNMHELALQPEYRPWYESGCKILNCELPLLRDFRKIRASNLVVRSHPNLKNILIVDVIMTNQAAYKQPYPILELIFSNVTGRVSASRRFLPAEYLHGELSGATAMLENQPVHLSLEILDPGPEANSYSMRLHEIDYM